MAGLKNTVFSSAFSLNELVPYRENRVLSRSLCDSDDFNIVLFSLDKDEEISDETIPDFQFIIITEGKVKIKTEDKTSILTTGNCIAIEPEVIHSIYAMEKSNYVHLYITK